MTFKPSLVLLTFLLLISCDKDLLGPIATLPIRFDEVKHTQVSVEWSETFSYDENHRLIEVNRSRSRRYQLSYDQSERIRSFRIFEPNDSLVKFIDSIIYDLQGRVKYLNLYERNRQNQFEQSRSTTYHYDSLNQVIRISKRRFNGTPLFEEKHYFWENGNIAREEYGRGRNGGFGYRFEWVYDDNPNYLNFSPYYIRDPYYWNKNNPVAVYVTDSIGDLSIHCWPCTFDVSYNKQGLLLKLDTRLDNKIEVSYR